MNIVFTPKIKTLHCFKKKFSAQEIEDEPMIYNGDPEYSYKNGGPITRIILDKLFETDSFKNRPKDLYSLVDTKVVMVNKGQYPCLGGWHCDDIPRVDNDHQPDMNKLDQKVRHWLVFFSNIGDLTGTEFVTNSVEIPVDENNVWGSTDQWLENNSNLIKTRKAKDGELIEFNQLALHRGSPANNFGWRFFFRLTMSTRKPTNKIRKQVQVYTRG